MNGSLGGRAGRLATAVAVAGLLAACATPSSRPGAATTSPPGPAARSSSSVPPGSPSGPPAGASQSPAEAARDHVPARIAALRLADRLAPVPPLYPEVVTTRVAGPGGVWVISRPDLTALTTTGCLAADTGSGVRYQACADYSEVLLLSADRSRILRAVPVPAAPAQWLLGTADALYAGRQGDGAIPDSMVMRIGLEDGTVTGTVFPARDVPDPGLSAADVAAWPGRWALAAPADASFDEPSLSRGVLTVTDRSHHVRTRLDARTLTPV